MAAVIQVESYDDVMGALERIDRLHKTIAAERGEETLDRSDDFFLAPFRIYTGLGGHRQ